MIPGQTSNCAGPQEEQLNPDLTLFLRNMKKIDQARNMPSPGSKPQKVSTDAPTARYTIELESEGKDFHIVFKNQEVALSAAKDLMISSIVATLAIRGFVLREQVLSFFSNKTKNFVAAAKRPIPPDAVIPAEDVDKNGRLTLKIWPPE